MTSRPVLEAVLRRERLIVVAGLCTVTALSWAYILLGAGMGMGAFETASATMRTPARWDLGYAVLMFFMWWIMMIAMMLPSASPMILMYARVRRKESASRPTASGGAIPSAIFTAGYLLAWAGFSLAAVSLQWLFEQSGLLSSMMASTDRVFGGMILLAAGLYQFTPVKRACLDHCRSPVHFLSRHWRKGRGGALVMGLEHGAYCLGCCWFLMGLLFFGGVMNLYWISGLALFVLFEKTVPAGHWLAYGAGLVLAGWGGRLLISALG